MVTASSVLGANGMDAIALIFQVLMAITLWFTISRKIRREHIKNMDLKLNVTEFKEYKSDHEKKHEDLKEDITYIRKSVDSINEYLRAK